MRPGAAKGGGGEPRWMSGLPRAASSFSSDLKSPSAIEGMKIRSGTRIHHEWTAVVHLQLANAIED